MDAGEAPLFAFDHVGVDGPQGPMLVEVTADVPPRGITVVVGPSGAGKSTFLRLCNRLEVPSRGQVRFRGRDVRELDPLELRRAVGMVFQRPTPFGGTVLDNLRAAAPGLDEAGALEALRRAELPPDFLGRPAGELSGGEAQRVCLARTLVTAPEALLMDEPTSALDDRPRRALERLALGLARSGVAILWVTHRLDQMRQLADRVIVIVGGRSRYCGPVGGLAGAEDPEVMAFLAGEHEPATDGGCHEEAGDAEG